MIFRVGGKDKGTRFLSYVEAVHGFRHLLTQEDLDRALSLCTSLKGHLRSRFIVLSDDRVLPPYQGNRGKRSHPDNDQENVSGKRYHHAQASNVNPVTPGVPSFVPGVAPITSFQTIKAGAAFGQVWGQGQANPGQQVNSQVAGAAFGQVWGQGQANPGQQVNSQVAVPAPVLPPQSIAAAYPVTSGSFPPLVAVPMPAQAQPAMLAVASMNVPPPALTQPPPPATTVVSGGAPASPAFNQVLSRRRKAKVKDKAKEKAAPKQPSATRLTPSRAVKDKGPKESHPAVGLTSPGDNYESCDSSSEAETAEPMADVNP